MLRLVFVYEWTNAVNGKKYLGSHGGSPNDAYIGSGVAFKNAVKKYGLVKFTREILYVGADYTEIEELLLEQADAANKLYYNQTNKALGATLHGTKNGMYGKKHSQETLDRIANTLVRKYATGEKKTNSAAMRGENNPMCGRATHTYVVVARAKMNAGKTFEEIHGVAAAAILRQKLKTAHAGKKQKWISVTCPHCKLSSRGPNMTRYYFDKCKKKDI